MILHLNTGEHKTFVEKSDSGFRRIPGSDRPLRYSSHHLHRQHLFLQFNFAVCVSAAETEKLVSFSDLYTDLTGTV